MGLLGSRAVAQDPSSPAPASDTAKASVDLSPAAIVQANTLQAEGSRPFHLKMDFQVFDLKGKPAEQGTIEYWWAGPDGFHLDVTAPSLGTVHNSRLDGLTSPLARRTLYLATQLLDAARSPGSGLGLPRAQVESEQRTMGSSSLTCLHPAVPSDHMQPLLPIQVCADAQTGTIRLVETPEYVIVRNRLGNFGLTCVALDLSIEWGHVASIKGQITALKSFRGADATTELEKPKTPEETKASPPGSIRLAGGVIAGNKIGGPRPEYPPAARQMGVSGTVVLIAEITKEGTVASLFPLSSPNASLTMAATNAVSEWTYKPYLLNGSPVSVTTTITVNFNLNGPAQSR